MILSSKETSCGKYAAEKCKVKAEAKAKAEAKIDLSSALALASAFFLSLHDVDQAPFS